MRFFTALFVLASAASTIVATPSPVAGVAEESHDLAKREISYGNPDLVTNQGNQFKLDFGSTEGHPNACPGHYTCYISKKGSPHGDVSPGNPDNMVDEGNRWRVNYGSTRGHPNACDGHYICYISK